MHHTFLWSAAALALALSATAAQANTGSAATAALNFTVLAGPGFAWSSDPADISFAESDAAGADFAGWTLAAGVFSPEYGPGSSDFSGTVVGTAVPTSSASASGDETFGSAFTFSDASARLAALSASAVVPTAGAASGTAFSRAFFTLAPGASATFSGSLFLSLAGSNAALPANYDLSDFYGYASGLLAVGNNLLDIELGGPALTSAPGAYALNDIAGFSFTVTNTDAFAMSYSLDAGVTVYSASVVPEPETYALLLGGLGLVAFVARRRQRA